MKSTNCAVLVLSCDKYSDVWQPFFSLFFKYWSDCPYPVYLGTNKKIFPDKRVIQVFSNRNTTWSEELEIILKQIPCENILIILEDYFIYQKINSEKVDFFLKVMQEKDAAFIRLGAFPKKYNSLYPYTKLPDYPEVGVVEKGSMYRISLQTGIWNKNVLLQFLGHDETPWQFETEASKRSNSVSKPFLCVVEDEKKNYVHGPIIYFCSALKRGRWIREALKLCEKEKIQVRPYERPVETKWEEIKRKIYIALPFSLRKIVRFFIYRLRMRNS
jgi:hypothetical protein